MPVKIDFKKIILVLLLLAAVVCIVLGFYDEKSSTFSFQTDAAREQLRIICLFMCILIAVFVNTVFHEAGHYIAGKDIDSFAEEAGNQQTHSRVKIVRTVFALRFELRQQVLRTLDRSRNQLRKE